MIVINGKHLNRFLLALPRQELDRASMAAGFESALEFVAVLKASVLFQGWTEDSIKGYLVFQHKDLEETTFDAFFEWFGDSGGDFDIEPTAAELFSMVDSAFEVFLNSRLEHPSGTEIAPTGGEISGNKGPV